MEGISVAPEGERYQVKCIIYTELVCLQRCTGPFCMLGHILYVMLLKENIHLWAWENVVYFLRYIKTRPGEAKTTAGCLYPVPQMRGE